MQRLVLIGRRVHRERLLCDRRRRVKEGTCRAIQFRVMRAPHQIAGADAAAIHCVIGEAELQRAIQLRRHVINTAAFFVFLRAAPIGRVEHDAITGFQRSDLVRRRRLHGRRWHREQR